MNFTMNPGPAVRIPPVAGPHAYKTYRVTAPKTTHWRPATCQEVGCANFLSGWFILVDLSTQFGQRQAHLIQTDKAHSFTVERLAEQVVRVIYPPGQPCFAASDHRARIPGLLNNYLVVGGDWRGNPRGERRVHQNGQDWAEDCAEHVSRISTALERG